MLIAPCNGREQFFWILSNCLKLKPLMRFFFVPESFLSTFLSSSLNCLILLDKPMLRFFRAECAE